MALIFVISDFLMLFLAEVIAIVLRFWIIGTFDDLTKLWRLLFFIPMTMIIYFSRGLYPAIGVSPVEELRRLFSSTTISFFIITSVSFWFPSILNYSRLIFIVGWIFSFAFVQLGRWFLRFIGGKAGFWGEPVLIMGGGLETWQLLRFLNKNPHIGLKPSLVVITNNSDLVYDGNVPVFHLKKLTEFDEFLQNNFVHINSALLVSNETSEDIKSAILDEQRLKFSHVIVVLNFGRVGNLGLVPYDLEGLMGLEVKQHLLAITDKVLKRIIDVAVSLFALFCAAPLITILGAIVRLESPGPIFYSHQRIGQNGRKFNVLKFRTMRQDADAVLQSYLEQNPEAMEEWKSCRKLKFDPRVTRIGRFLRKSSLDEIPQIVNVLKGEMSLVGPRPIVEDEIELYQEGFKLYTKVLPGITGLWQVSGRNDTTYSERVRLDEYYVRNWSIWLDIYIIFRTIVILMNRNGAY